MRYRPHTLLVALGLAVALPASAAGIHVDLEPAPVSVPASTDFTVNLTIFQADASFNAFDAYVVFDPSRVSFVSGSNQAGPVVTAACGNLFQIFKVDNVQPADLDTLEIHLSLLCNNTSMTGPGSIYRVKFHSGTTPGGTSITWGASTHFYDAGRLVTPLETRNLPVQIQCPAIGAAPSTLPHEPRDAPFSLSLSGTGGTAPYTFTLASGALPPGVGLSAAGVISGTPTATGSYGFGVTTTDAVGCSGTQGYTLVIDCPLLAIAADAGAGGAISPSGVVGVACGQNQSFSIAPDACHAIADVLVDGGSFGPVSAYTFTNLQASHTIHATFAATTYPITSTSGAGGTISPSGALGVDCGQSASFTITPDDCNAIAAVVVDGVSVGAVASYTFENVHAAHTITASFAPQTFTVLASAGDGGTVAPSGALPVGCGDDASFTITPGDCYTIADVVVDGGSVGAVASYTFANVVAAHTLSATFAPQTRAILATAGAGGSITPSGVVTVTCGADAAFSMTPADPCHVVADVLVDGVSVGAVGTYTFMHVEASHTIAATFAARVLDATPAALPPGVTGAAYSQTLTGTGGTAPYAFTLQSGALPDGLGLSGAGVISGTPTTPGSATFTIAFADAHGCTGSRPYTLTIDCAAITIVPPALPNGNVGAAYAQTLTGNGGAAPYQFTVVAGALPGGLALATDGSLTGSPTDVGVFTFTAKATDAHACAGTRDYSLTIDAANAVGDGPVTRFALEALTPNPWRAGAPGLVRFALPATAAVRVELFDVRGRRVASRPFETLAPGHHVMPWAPTLAPGVYRVRLTSSTGAIATGLWVVLR